MDTTQIIKLIDTTQVHLTNEQIKTAWDYVKDLLPIVTLILGAGLGFGANKLIEHLNFKKTRKYFFFALQTLNEGVTLQIECYREYIEFMKSDSNFSRPLKLSMSFTLKAINIVSYQDIYKMLVLKNNDKKKMIDLMNGFNKIQSIVESYEKIDEMMFNSCLRTVQSFGDSMGKLKIEIESYIKSVKKNNIADRLQVTKEIEDIGFKFYSKLKPTDDTTMKTVIEGYIKPLKSYLEQENLTIFQQSINIVESYYYEFMNNRENFIQLATVDKNNLKSIEAIHHQILENYKEFLD